MTVFEAYQLLPKEYYYNTWYEAEYNNIRFEITVNKRRFLRVRRIGEYNIKDENGKILRKDKCYHYYRQNKKNQWEYETFEPIYN